MAVVGAFDKKVLLQVPVKAQDAAGGNEETGWTTICACRARVRKTSGFKSMTEGYTGLVSEYTVEIYWRNAIESQITKDTHIVYTNKLLAVQSFEIVGEAYKTVLFTCLEVQ